MKSKILKTFLFFVLFSVILITASFAVEIKENPSNYKSSVFIIGSTRFDSQQIITADKLFDAGINEKELYDLMAKDIKQADRTLYYYVSENVGWLKIGETTEKLSQVETEKLEANLNIFFENNKEKILEVKFDGIVDEGSINDWGGEKTRVEFKDGRFYVPSLIFNFEFTSNGKPVEVYTNINDGDEEFGELEVMIKPNITFSVPDFLAIGEPTEFSINVIANSLEGENVRQRLSFNHKVEKLFEKLEYYNAEDKIWQEMKIEENDAWSAVTEEFKLKDGEIKFRAIFNDEPGTYNIMAYLLYPTYTVADTSTEITARKYEGTISYISGLSVEPTITKGNIYNEIDGKNHEVTNVNVNSGIVSWYPADTSVGRNEAGNRFGLKISAPAEYDYETYKDAKIVRRMYANNQIVGEPTTFEMKWSEVEDGDGTYYETWPLVTKDLYRIEIDITWKEGNTQTFIIHIDSSSLELQKPYSGTMSYLGGLSTAPTVYPEGEYEQILTTSIGGNIVSWYPADKSVGRNEPGNRVGFKITAPVEYTQNEYATAKIVRKMYYVGNHDVPVEIPMTWDKVKDSDTYYTTWPLITSDLHMIEIDVEWEKGNTQTFRIYTSGVELQQPYSGTMSYLGGLSTEPMINPEGEYGKILTANIGGNIVTWYPEDSELNRAEGNRFGFKITAPIEYTKNEYAKANITRRMYYSENPEIPEVTQFTWDEVKDGDTYFGIWPLTTINLDRVEIDVEWEEGNTQTFRIYTSGVILQAPQYKGTISYIDGLSVAPEVSGDTVNVNSGEVSWYPEDSELNRTEGNRFGLKITAPTEYKNNEYMAANIIRKMYYSENPEIPVETQFTWDEVKDGDTYFGIWPLVTEDLEKVVIDIVWDYGTGEGTENKQTFTINVADEVTLAAPANAVIQVGKQYFAEAEIENALAQSSINTPAVLYKDNYTLSNDIVIRNGNSLVIPEGKTLNVCSNIMIEEDGELIVEGILDLQVYGDLETPSIGTLQGNIAVKGGTVISNGTKITGTAEGTAYKTNDAVFGLTADLSGLTVVSGEIVLGESFNTMPGQTLVLKSGTKFTIPEGKTLYVYSDLTVEEGATMIVKGNLKLEEGSEFTVKGTLEFIDGATIDGDVALKGGRWITNMYNMAGPDGCKFTTIDAVFTMKPQNYDMVVVSGEVALGENHRTFPGQNIVITKDAKFTVPAGMTLQVYSTVTIEEGANVVVAGTLSIEQGGSITGKYTVTETGLVVRQVNDDDSLKSALVNAKAGDTINLAAGNYSEVLIDSRKNVAKNLTLVGTEGVKIAGVNMDGQHFGFVPEGLTFKNITFTGDVVVNNTDSRGMECKKLSIIGCTFTNAAFVAGAGSSIDGLTIENNKFNGTNTNHKTSVYLKGAHINVLIKGNTIEGSAFNGVQFTDILGKVTIDGNTIKNTGSRAIRITTKEGAELTISNNIISNVNTDSSEAAQNNGQVIKVTGTVTTPTAEGNTYNGEALNIIDGIAVAPVEE